MKKITLTRMGCDFRAEDQGKSDCQNYRLRMAPILTKDGKMVGGDFGRGVRYDFSKKKPRKVTEWQIHTDFDYTDENGLCWRYTPDGQGGNIKNYDSVLQNPFYGKDYCLATIKEIINSMAAEPVDVVEIE